VSLGFLIPAGQRHDRLWLLQASGARRVDLTKADHRENAGKMSLSITRERRIMSTRCGLPQVGDGGASLGRRGETPI
jgi:hypothetical protein